MNSDPHSLGFGLGLRPDHYQAVLEASPAIDWFEVISENYMVPGGRPLYFLDRIRERYPMVMHGVSMSIGSTDALNMQYLSELKLLAQRVQPAWISDHLCWTGVHGVNLHDLMPLPYTDEALRHVAARVQQVQDFLGRRLLLENVSSYVSYAHSTMQEWEFLTALTQEVDALEFLRGVPATRVRQMHLAGHTRQGACLIDTHDQPVPDAVWDLFAVAARMFPNVSTMIERDGNIPALDELVAELEHARRIAAELQIAAA
jgi:hypothetical protein